MTVRSVVDGQPRHLILLMRAYDAARAGIGRIPGASRGTELLTSTLIAALPFLLSLALRPFDGGCGGTSILWLLYFGLLTSVALVFGRLTWSRLARTAPAVDVALGNNTNRRTIARWLQNGFSIPAQVVVFCLGGALSTAVFAYIQPSLALYVDVCTASYVTVGFVGGVFGMVVHSMLVGALTIRRFCLIPDLKLRSIDPVHTPAIRGLSALAAAVAFWGGTGILLSLIPLLYAFTRPSPPQFLGHIVAIAGLGATLIVAFEGIVSQWWLSRAAAGVRASTLDGIAEQLDGGSNLSQAERRDALALYELVLASSASTVRVEVLVETSFGVLAVASTFLVYFLSK